MKKQQVLKRQNTLTVQESYKKILEKIEGAQTERERELVIEEYKKTAITLKDRLGDWVENNQLDILKIAEDYKKLGEHVGSVEGKLPQASGLLKKIGELNHLVAQEGSENKETENRLRKLMKLHISDLVAATSNDPVLSLLKTPAKIVQEKQAFIQSKILEESKTCFTFKESCGKDIGKVLEEFELAVLTQNVKKGVELLLEVSRLKSGEIGSFQNLGRIRKLRNMFISSLNFEKCTFEEFLTFVDCLVEAGGDDSERVFFSGFSFFTKQKIEAELQDIKNSEGVITRVDDVCLAVKSIFKLFLQMAELLKSKYTFGKRTFGYWVVQQSTVVFNEIFLHISEDILVDWRHLDTLINNLEITLGSFDQKGLSTHFIFRDFISQIKKNTNYEEKKEQEADFVSSEEL